MAPPSAIRETSAAAILAQLPLLCNPASTLQISIMPAKCSRADSSNTDNRSADGAPERLFEDARSHFSEHELCDLTLATATVNAWNRLSIPARLVPGGYQPAKRPEMVTQA